MYHRLLLPRRAEGMWVWMEEDDEPYLDLVMGFSSVNFGHGHPVVVDAVRECVGQLAQVHSFHTRAMLELSRLLVRSLEADDDYRVYFDVGGSNAVDTAVRLCRAHWKRPSIVAFGGAFHGTGFLTGALTDERLVSRSQYEPCNHHEDIVRIDFPDPYRGFTEAHCLERVEAAIRRHNPAAVIVEPIQGAAGFITPTPRFLSELRSLTRSHDLGLIADEIQVGVGRTGYLYSSARSSVVPDIILLSKSLAGGAYPLSAVVARSCLFETAVAERTALQATFANNALGTQVALRVLEYALREQVFDHAARVGPQLLACLSPLASHPNVDNLHGIGLAIAFEFVADKETREPAPELAREFVAAALDEHVLVYRCGVFRNIIKVAPPLTILAEELRGVADALLRSLQRAMEAG